MTPKTKTPLDVVVISTIRGELLDLTLHSFKHGILRHFDARILINIDPIGETYHATQQDMLAICKKYFDNIIANTPSTPSFAKAVKWGWSQVKTPIFFHLEDDWLILKDIPIQDALARFNDERVVEVILHATKGNIPHLTPYIGNTDNYLYHPALSLRPSFFRTPYVKELVNQFDTKKDPEVQFGQHKGQTPSYPYPIYLKFKEKDQIFDSGSKWRSGQKIQRSRYGSSQPIWLARKKEFFFVNCYRWWCRHRLSSQLKYLREKHCPPILPAVVKAAPYIQILHQGDAHNHAVIQVALGKTRPHYDYSIKSFTLYCQRHNLHHLLVTQERYRHLIKDRLPHMRYYIEKIQLFDALANGYQRVLYVDSDVVASQYAPNIFDLHSLPHIVYFHNEIAEGQDYAPYYETKNGLCHVMNIKDDDGKIFPSSGYHGQLNAGVMLFSQPHLKLKKHIMDFLQKTPERLMPPRNANYFVTKTIKNLHDQNMFNAIIVKHAPFACLDPSFNALPTRQPFSAVFGESALNNALGQRQPFFYHYIGSGKGKAGWHVPPRPILDAMKEGFMSNVTKKPLPKRTLRNTIIRTLERS